MKVILSSRLHLNNPQLSALYKLLNKNSLAELKVLFITDAASDSAGNIPEWAQVDVAKFRAIGAKVTLCDLSTNDPKLIEQEVGNSDILFFEGGSTPKLLHAIKNSLLLRLLNSGSMIHQIWFGISAGGCVLSPKCYSSCEKWFMENPVEQPVDGLTKDGSPYFIPHFKSKDFLPNTEDNLKYVRAKLHGHQAILGTDDCVVTGSLASDIFTPDLEMHEAVLLAER